MQMPDQLVAKCCPEQSPQRAERSLGQGRKGIGARLTNEPRLSSAICLSFANSTKLKVSNAMPTIVAKAKSLASGCLRSSNVAVTQSGVNTVMAAAPRNP